MTLKTPWRDTTHLRFEPLTLLERLAALTPRPRINVVIYHGILAPHAAGRAAAVGYGRADDGGRAHDHGRAVPAAPAPGEAPRSGETMVTPSPAAVSAPAPMPPPVMPPTAPPCPTAAPGTSPSSRWRWADLLQRVFAVDVLACPRCGGRMRVLATIDDPRVVRRILTHLGLLDDAGPPPEPPARRAA